jgi:hypothetical protein
MQRDLQAMERVLAAGIPCPQGRTPAPQLEAVRQHPWLFQWMRATEQGRFCECLLRGS